MGLTDFYAIFKIGLMWLHGSVQLFYFDSVCKGTYFLLHTGGNL